MSSGTCNASVDGGKCSRPDDHPGDHMGPVTPVLCGEKQSERGLASCMLKRGHAGSHSDFAQGAAWPQAKTPEPLLEQDPDLFEPADDPGPTVPHCVRTRVELHRAQTAYDLTILRDRLDTVTVSTAESRRLRKRREQLTAELDAWVYLARMARSPR